jgi:positive regulator of sigma E activity
MGTSDQVTGMVTRVDTQAGQVRLKVDDESLCTLCCSQETQIHGEEQVLDLEALQPGDYVRIEGLTDKDGRLLASRIVVLRPAWRMLESPET